MTPPCHCDATRHCSVPEFSARTQCRTAHALLPFYERTEPFLCHDAVTSLREASQSDLKAQRGVARVISGGTSQHCQSSGGLASGSAAPADRDDEGHGPRQRPFSLGARESPSVQTPKVGERRGHFAGRLFGETRSDVTGLVDASKSRFSNRTTSRRRPAARSD